MDSGEWLFSWRRGRHSTDWLRLDIFLEDRNCRGRRLVMTIVIGNLPRVVASVFGVVFFATIGVLCLFRTAAVRDFALRNAAKKIGSMSNPASSWMQTSPVEESAPYRSALHRRRRSPPSYGHSIEGLIYGATTESYQRVPEGVQVHRQRTRCRNRAGLLRGQVHPVLLVAGSHRSTPRQ